MAFEQGAFGLGLVSAWLMTFLDTVDGKLARVTLTIATLFGRPDLGLIAIRTWTLCCIFIQCVRIVQAAAFQMRGREISPFIH